MYRYGRYGQPLRVGLMRKSVHMRRWFLCNPWSRPMLVFVFAAIRIQQVARGFVVRRHGSLRRAVEYRRQCQTRRGKKSASTSQRQLDKYLAYLDTVNLSRPGSGGVSDTEGNFKPVWLDGGYSAWCAVRIQACWRRVKPKRRFLNKRRFVLQIATLIIQTAVRNRLEMKRRLLRAHDFSYIANMSSPRRREEMRAHAAHRIQLRWKTYCNRRIFAYFRELVCFKLQGAPSDLLKTIIPQETGLFDRAAGVHVRFRLGGARFPPKVYFKVFTHRPLCDVNAFAPRDYTLESKPEAYHNNNHEKTFPKHSKSKRLIRVGAKCFGVVSKSGSSSSTSSWYQREENNNWRPIASQLVEEIVVPPWDFPREKKTATHYNTYKRREETLQLRKRRKREWMLKAYLLASGKSLAANPAQLIDVLPHSKCYEQKTRQYQAEKQSKECDLLWMDKTILSNADKDFEAELANLSLDEESKYGCMEDFKMNNDFDSKLMQHSQQQSVVSKVDVVLPVGGNNGIAGMLRAHRSLDDGEDLIDWSATLNFETYSDHWLRCGTSLPSSLK